MTKCHKMKPFDSLASQLGKVATDYIHVPQYKLDWETTTLSH